MNPRKGWTSHLVDSMAQRIENALMGHLGHRWVCVNRMGNVFKHGAHFKR